MRAVKANLQTLRKKITGCKRAREISAMHLI